MLSRVAVMLRELRVTFEDALPQMLGVPVYGHLAALHSSLVRSRDFEQRFIVVRYEGATLGILPVTSGLASAFSGHPVLSELHGEIRARRAVFVGCISEFYGGGVVARSSDPRESLQVLTSLARSAHSIGVDLDAQVIAPNVPHAQSPAFFQAGFAVDEARSIRLWHELAVAGMKTETAFLEQLDGKKRGRWRRDLELLDDFEVKALVGVSPLHYDETALALIADVRQRHGFATNPTLVEYELAEWVHDEADGLVTFAVGHAAGGVEAVCFAKIRRDALELHYVGIVDGPRRGQLYRAAAFAAPLRFAIDHGLSTVVYGSGQDTPKLLRGAHSEPLYTMRRREPEGTV